MHCHEGFLGQDLLQKHLKTPEAVQTGLIYYSPNPSFREAAKYIWWQSRNKQLPCPSWSEITTEKTKRTRKIITAFKPPCWGQYKAFQTYSWQFWGAFPCLKAGKCFREMRGTQTWGVHRQGDVKYAGAQGEMWREVKKNTSSHICRKAYL